MKKFFAIVLAVAMVMSMGSAFAALGWAQSVSSATATASVTVSVKALEYSGTSQDYTQYGLDSATVWKQITGTVVKDTLVKFPVTVKIPDVGDSGLNTFDYVNQKIVVTLTNATVFEIMAADSSSSTGYTSCMSQFTLDSSQGTATLNLSDGTTGAISFTVLGIVKSTAQTKCSVTYTMGQSPVGDGVTPIRFGKFEAYWTDGVSLVVTDTADDSSIYFGLNSNNLFTSSIRFRDAYLGSTEYEAVAYCVNGELTFGGKCGCTPDLILAATYAQVKADFNEILNVLGFSFGYGSYSAAYCTAAGLKSLTKQVSVTDSVTINGSTNITVPGNVTIPQTGALSLAGYALVSLAGAALAISRKKK